MEENGKSESNLEKTTADYTKTCPACGEQIPFNSRVCNKCGYVEGEKGGYQPMTPQQIKKVRGVLFAILMVVAIIVYVLVFLK